MDDKTSTGLRNSTPITSHARARSTSLSVTTKKTPLKTPSTTPNTKRLSSSFKTPSTTPNTKRVSSTLKSSVGTNTPSNLKQTTPSSRRTSVRLSTTYSRALYISENLLLKKSGEKQLKDIVEIHIDDKQGKIKLIEGLEKCTRLEKLRLENHEIDKIRNLSTLTTLKELRLRKNVISVLDGLDTLKNLTLLDVSFNKIEIIPKNITVLHSLETFHIQHNKIQALDSLAKLNRLHNLHTLSIEGNPCHELAHYKLWVIYKIPNVKILDGVEVLEEDRKMSKDRYYVSEIEALELKLKELNTEHSKVLQEQKTLKKDHEMLEKNHEVLSETFKTMSQEHALQNTEILTKSELLDQSSREITYLFEMLYQMQQQLAYANIDHQFDLSLLKEYKTKDIDVTENPYIGKNTIERIVRPDIQVAMIQRGQYATHKFENAIFKNDMEGIDPQVDTLQNDHLGKGNPVGDDITLDNTTKDKSEYVCTQCPISSSPTDSTAPPLKLGEKSYSLDYAYRIYMEKKTKYKKKIMEHQELMARMLDYVFVEGLGDDSYYHEKPSRLKYYSDYIEECLELEHRKAYVVENLKNFPKKKWKDIPIEDEDEYAYQLLKIEKEEGKDRVRYMRKLRTSHLLQSKATLEEKEKRNIEQIQNLIKDVLYREELGIQSLREDVIKEGDMTNEEDLVKEESSETTVHSQTEKDVMNPVHPNSFESVDEALHTLNVILKEKQSSMQERLQILEALKVTNFYHSYEMDSSHPEWMNVLKRQMWFLYQELSKKVYVYNLKKEEIASRDVSHEDLEGGAINKDKSSSSDEENLSSGEDEETLSSEDGSSSEE